MCKDNKNSKLVSELVVVSVMDHSEAVFNMIMKHILEYWYPDAEYTRRSSSSIDEVVESVKNAKAAIILGSKEAKEAIDACLENSLPRVLYIFRYNENAIPIEACLKQPGLNLYVIPGMVVGLQRFMLLNCIDAFLEYLYRVKTR